MFYKSIRLYSSLIRFEKPIGSLLLLWPTLWAIVTVNKQKSFVSIISTEIFWIFILGVFIMRSAGCIINDVCDKEYDGHVKRTKNRVLINQLSLKQAFIFLFVLLLVALCCLIRLVILTKNYYLIWHCLIALSLTSIYPLCKRFFACPQFVLGLAFGYSILLVYSSYLGRVDRTAWILYGLSIILTIIYDNFYAMADISDDLKLGLKSSVIWFGKYNLHIIISLQLLFVLLLFYFDLVILDYSINIKMLLDSKIISLVIIKFIIVGLFLYQIFLVSRTNLNNSYSKNCISAFKNSSWIGFLVLMNCIILYS